MNEQALREFFTFGPRDVDADLGERWCDECGIRTNHRTAQHLAAEADRLADEADRRNDARKEGD